MADSKKDNWSSQEYQHSADFVPKLATKVVQWLDAQENDVILDIGCGDGVLDVEFGKLLVQGSGSLIGVDSSPAMIDGAKRATEEAGVSEKCSFRVVDANALGEQTWDRPFTKVFSNAAMHWILKPDSASRFFSAVRDVLPSGGTFTFEMGGLGNVTEMRTALLMATARQVGNEKARAADPWFFPDESWTKRVMEEEVGGWKVERIEREWRPTAAGKGGVEGWVRLMGKEFLDLIDREKGTEAMERATNEAAEALRLVCDDGSGGEMISYVRLRCLARKL